MAVRAKARQQGGGRTAPPAPQARPDASHALRPGSPSSGVHLQVAEVESLQRQAGNKAVTVLLQRDKAPVSAGTKAERSFRLGEKAFGRRDYGHAYDYFKRADQYRHFPEISFSIAQCLWHLGGRNEEAIGLYRIYIAEMPNGARVKHAAEAIAELSTAVSTGDDQSDRKIAEKFYRLGESMFRQRKFRAAAFQFEKAYRLLPIAELAFSQAQSLRRAGVEAEKAVELYETYLRDKPAGPRAKHAKEFIAELRAPEPTGDRKTDLGAAEKAYRRGEACYHEKKFSRAYVLFTKADDLAHMPEITFSRAQALRAAGGRTEEAIRLFQLYIEEMPNGSRVHHARSHILEMRELGASV